MNESGTWLAQTHELFQGVSMERERDGINRCGCVACAHGVLLTASREPKRPPHAYKQRDTCEYGS
jgi:hypothetical protein